MLPIPWHSFDGELAERFISILLLRDFPDGSRRRPTQGDGGIDVIVPVSDDPPVYDVYQIKKYFEPLKADQKRKIETSAARLAATIGEQSIQVRKWHLTLPVDGSGDDEEWLRGLLPAQIITRWKGRTFLEGLCAKYRDVVDYYVLGGQERLHELVRMAMNLVPAKPGPAAAGVNIQSFQDGVMPWFDQLNSTDPHFIYNVSLLHSKTLANSSGLTREQIVNSTPAGVVQSRILRKDGGSILRVDVYRRYQLALEDRRLGGKIHIRVPESEPQLRKAVEDFDIFGDDLSLPAEFVSVTMDDSLSGDVQELSTALEIFATAPKTQGRLRLIVAEATGERVASAFFETTRFSEGPSQRGFSITLTSESKLLKITQRSESTEISAGRVGPTRITIEAHWPGLIAAQAMPEIQFARAIRPDRKVLIAPEFTGPFLDFLEPSPGNKQPIPEWVERYAAALVELQPYADAPLRISSVSSDDDVSKVEHAIRIASLLHGAELVQHVPALGLQVPNPETSEAISGINESGALRTNSEFVEDISNGRVIIPSVEYLIENVSADLALIDGVQQIMLTPKSGELVIVRATLPRE